MMNESFLERKVPDPQLLRQTFSLFPSGVACIGARIDGRSEALVASSFTVGVSLEPALVSFAVQQTSSTWPRLRGAAQLGVSVMASDQEQICRQIAARDRDQRFDGVGTHIGTSGSLFLTGSPVWLECTVYREYPAGDHDLVLLEVDGLGLNPNLSPLLFHRSTFRQIHDES